MILNKIKTVNILSRLLKEENISQIKHEILEIKENLSNFKADELGLLNIASNGDTVNIESKRIMEICSIETI